MTPGHPWIEAVLFDYGDTLMDEDRYSADVANAAFAALALGELEPPPDLLGWYRSIQSAIRLKHGALPLGQLEFMIRATWGGQALARLGQAPNPAADQAAYQAMVAAAAASACLFPETRELLATLHGRYRLGIVSNGHGVQVRASLDNLGLTRFFDAILVSDEEGVEKPDPRIFHRAVERLGVRPKRAVMVGNLVAADVVGAEQAGLRGIWVDRRDGAGCAGATRPSLVLNDLRTLPEMLADLTPVSGDTAILPRMEKEQGLVAP